MTDTARHTNAAGLALIKKSEGLRLHAYQNAGDVPTIGWGHTRGVRMGQVITRAQAEQLLSSDLTEFEAGVAKLAPIATDNQFSAMVSFAFNEGLGALAKSTLLRDHNAGDHNGAQAQFLHWYYAAGKENEGLKLRRRAEAALYGDADDAR